MGYHSRAYAPAPKAAAKKKSSLSFTPEAPAVQAKAVDTPAKLPEFNPDPSIFHTDLDNPYASLFGSPAPAPIQAKAEAPQPMPKIDYDASVFQTDWDNPYANCFGPPPLPTTPLPIQAQLTVGAVGDKYEQEADQVAANVVRSINQPQGAVQKADEREQTQISDQSVQRESEEEEELQMKPQEAIQREGMEEEEVQMKPTLQRVGKAGGAVDSGVESQINSAKGNGQPLDSGLQQSMGQAMGADFSGVKVHTDSQSNHLNESIQSKAFTTGSDVFFRSGEYNPGSKGGQELIAHELTHVVQQGGASSGLQRQSDGVIQRDGDEENNPYKMQYAYHSKKEDKTKDFKNERMMITHKGDKPGPIRWNNGARVVPVHRESWRNRARAVYPAGGDIAHQGIVGDPLYQQRNFHEFRLEKYPHIDKSELNKYDNQVREDDKKSVANFMTAGAAVAKQKVFTKEESDAWERVYLSKGGKLLTVVPRVDKSAQMGKYIRQYFPMGQADMNEQDPEHTSSHVVGMTHRTIHKHVIYPGGAYQQDLTKFIRCLEDKPGMLGPGSGNDKKKSEQVIAIGDDFRTAFGLPKRSAEAQQAQDKKKPKKAIKKGKYLWADQGLNVTFNVKEKFDGIVTTGAGPCVAVALDATYQDNRALSLAHFDESTLVDTTLPKMCQSIAQALGIEDLGNVPKDSIKITYHLGGGVTGYLKKLVPIISGYLAKQPSITPVEGKLYDSMENPNTAFKIDKDEGFSKAKSTFGIDAEQFSGEEHHLELMYLVYKSMNMYKALLESVKKSEFLDVEEDGKIDYGVKHYEEMLKHLEVADEIKKNPKIAIKTFEEYINVLEKDKTAIAGKMKRYKIAGSDSEANKKYKGKKLKEFKERLKPINQRIKGVKAAIKKEQQKLALVNQ